MSGLQAFNIIVIFGDLISAVALGILIVRYHDVVLRLFPVSKGVGLYVSALGLIGQSYRNYQFLKNGVSPADNEVMLWVLKDLGFWILTLDMLYTLTYPRGINFYYSRRRSDTRHGGNNRTIVDNLDGASPNVQGRTASEYQNRMLAVVAFIAICILAVTLKDEIKAVILNLTN